MLLASLVMFFYVAVVGGCIAADCCEVTTLTTWCGDCYYDDWLLNISCCVSRWSLRLKLFHALGLDHTVCGWCMYYYYEVGGKYGGGERREKRETPG